MATIAAVLTTAVLRTVALIGWLLAPATPFPAAGIPPAAGAAPAEVIDQRRQAEAGGPAARGQEPANATDDPAEAFLRELEQAGGDIESLKAGIRYTKVFVLEGDEQVRIGTLYFVSGEGAPDDQRRRRFAVHFDRLIFDGRQERESRSYVFDGEWLVEKLPEHKQMFKRQVVPPGESFDPLRIGEGPFPIPIGQPAAEILSRFDAELLAEGEGTDALDPDVELWLQNPSHPVRGVKLTPKTSFAREFDLEVLHLWYLRDGLLPRAAWTRGVDGNETVVQLIAHEKNVPIEDDVLETETPGAGWDVEITPWRGEVGGGL